MAWVGSQTALLTCMYGHYGVRPMPGYFENTKYDQRVAETNSRMRQGQQSPPTVKMAVRYVAIVGCPGSVLDKDIAVSADFRVLARLPLSWCRC